MDRIERIPPPELEALGLQKLAGAVIRVTMLDGTTEITRLPKISLQDLTHNDNSVQAE